MNKKQNLDRKISKIIHIADVHIRQYKRLSEYEEVFENLYKSLEQNIDDNTIIALLGDIVHSKNELTPELVQLTSKFFKRLLEYSPVILIAGNHDTNLSNKNRLDALSPIVDLVNNPNLFYLKDTGLYKFGNVCFSVMSVFDNIEKYISADKIEAGYKKIALYHGPLNGAKNEYAFSLNGKLSTDFFNGYDIALLGDIHKRQILSKSPLVLYPGSLICQNFGEHPTDHGYAIINVDKKTASFVNIDNDYSYYTLSISDKDTDIPNIKMSKYPRVRIKFDNVEFSKISGFVHKIRLKYNPIELIYERINTKDSKNGFGTNLSSHIISNIRSLDYQNTYIKQYLKKTYTSLSNKIINDIIQINSDIYNNLHIDSMPDTNVWKPLELKWSNMFSYGEDNSINFNNLKGTVGLFGNNASGKSSFGEILAFSLFDKTSKEFKVINLINNRKSNFNCEMKFELNSKEYLLKRHAVKSKKGDSIKYVVEMFENTPNGLISLTGENRWETNKVLRNMIGDLEDYLLTSYSVQNNNLGFVQNSNTERKNLLIKILGLKIFDDLFDIANNKLREINTLRKQLNYDDLIVKLDSLETELNKDQAEKRKIEKKISETKENLDDLNNRFQELVSEKIPISDNLDIKQINKRDTELRKSLSESEIKIININQNLDELKSNLDLLEKFISKQNSIEEKYQLFLDSQNHINALNNARTVHINEISKIKTELEHVKSIKYDPNCEYCVKNVGNHKESIISNHQFHKSEADRIQREIKDAQDQFPDSKEIKDSFDRLKKALKLLPELNNNISVDKQKISDINNKINLIKIEIDKNDSNRDLYIKNEQNIQKNQDIDQKILKIKSDIDKNNNLIKTLNDTLIKVLLSIKTNEINIEDVSEKIKTSKKLEYDYECYNIYCESVKRDGIPYEIILSVLQQIETSANNTLRQIVDFSLLIQPDENKNINIYIVYNDEKYWSLELASGMEKFISAIAIRDALSSISTLPRPDFLMIDEGWGNLDSDNLSSVSRLLDYLKMKYRFIIVISHIDAIKDTVDQIIEIKSDKGFSKINYDT